MEKPESLKFLDSLTEKVGGVDLVFRRLSQEKPGESWILMVYGNSGTGKTYFCGTCGPRTLFINVGSGIETLLSPAFTSKYPESKNMIVIDINEQIMNVDANKVEAKAFDAVCDAVDVALEKFPDEFDTVVLDDATFLRSFALNKAFQQNNAERKNPRTSLTESYLRAEPGDYGGEMGMIEWFLATYIPIFKVRKKNFLMTAHERHIYGKPPKVGEQAPLIKVMPGFTGKTHPDKVPGFFDDVFRSQVVGGDGNRVYRLQTGGTEMETGKSRHGGIFESVIRDPNYQEMLKRIKAGVGVVKR